MFDLETINGKTYTKVPVELNGVVVKFVLVEVPSTAAAPVVADSEPMEAELISEEVQCDVRPQEAEIVEETVDASEDASDSPQPELQADIAEEVLEEDSEPTLVASPIAPQTTIEVDSCVEDEDFETRSESSTGSSTIDPSDDMDEEFPVLEGKVDKTETDAPFFATDLLSCYEFDNDLKVCWPSELAEYFLIAVDGKYVFNVEDLVDDEIEHNLVFRKTRQSVKRFDRQPVCYKPTYKTVQRIQVRTGPGSKYDACGIIPANAQVFVIQEGLLSCDLKLVVEWMSLHLPENMICEKLSNSNAQNFDEHIERALVVNSLKKWVEHLEDATQAMKVAATQAMKVATKTETGTLEAFAKMTYTADDQKEFLKAAKAANRKVKVMWTENGIEKCGWISKRKNKKSAEIADGRKTKPLITRVMGATAAPKVEVFNVKSNIPSFVQRLDCSFSKDAWHYKENAKRKVPSRHVKGEDDIVRCFPPMSFYTKLARSDIAKLIGSKRFSISWEGEFKLDRYRGMEKKRVICDDGKTRLKNGYYLPNDYMTITFERHSDANAFLNADLDDTRFSGAEAEACEPYANLHPVPAHMCPEYELFLDAVKKGKTDDSEECTPKELTDKMEKIRKEKAELDKLALERGIHYVTV